MSLLNELFFPILRIVSLSFFLTVADSTGTHSLYTTYRDYEIMFHVSTMLPYTPNNKQQVRDPCVFGVFFTLVSFPPEAEVASL